ncbi:MAG TPA: hypothetical protein VF219_04505, partial [Vicinamibacterales bacterium]
HQESIDKYLTEPPIDAARLRKAETVVNAIWREHESAAAGRFGEARGVLESGLREDPDNAYLQYLRSRQKTGDGKPPSSTRIDDVQMKHN